MQPVNKDSPPEKIVELNGEVFEILEHLGQGGMGVVYKGRQQRLERIVAIKMLHKHVTQSPEAVDRLQQEAKALARMQHPSIVKVYSLMMTAEDRRPFLVLEYVEGRTLAQWLTEKECLTTEEFYRVFMQVLAALQVAHDSQLIHRDLKPSNIMVSADLSVKLMDFGIAKALNDEDTDPQVASESGILIGSPAYMSPEQCKSGAIDSRADLYSVACCMYQALSGEVLFAGTTALETMMLQLHKVPTLAHAKLPKGFRNLLAVALEKNPDDRYPSAADFAQTLTATMAGKLPPSRLRHVNNPWLDQAVARKTLVPALICVLLAGVAWCCLALRPKQDMPEKPTRLFFTAAASDQSLNAVIGALHVFKNDVRLGKINDPAEIQAKSLAAVKDLQDIIPRLLSVSDSIRLVDAYLELETLWESIDRTKAIEVLQRARSVAARSKKDLRYDVILLQLGSNYRFLNEFKKSRSCFNEALSIKQEAAKEEPLANLQVTDIYRDLVTLDTTEGNLLQASKDLQSAKNAYEKAGVPDALRLWYLRDAECALLYELQRKEEALVVLRANRQEQEDSFAACHAELGLQEQGERSLRALDDGYRLEMQFAFREGKPQQGEKVFQQRCQSLHRSRSPGRLLYHASVEYAFQIRPFDIKASNLWFSKALDLAQSESLVTSNSVAGMRHKLRIYQESSPVEQAEYATKSLREALENEVPY